ncbi:MAG: saccharopine dehydrogenase C-terminal domain-containing protein, partial [Planctomycetota bacterium]
HFTVMSGVAPHLQADLADTAAVKKLVAPFDIVCGALSSRIGFQTLRAVIEAGKNFCDISFFAQDAMDLDALAKQHGVTAVVDCGVAPGMSNMAAGYAAEYFERCDTIAIYVGGLPRERRWPFEYKAGFSPADVLEEYVRPSRIVDRGETVIREALSEPQLLDFPGVGTLEAFNTDGLRSLASTLKSRVPTMIEKTMRYPGHIELMRVLRHIGLFSQTPIEVPGADGGTARIRPLDVISKLMFPLWTYEEGEEDMTVMRIVAEGLKNGQRERITWDLMDIYDQTTRATSMSRTTAFPCTIMAREVAAGRFKMPGVVPPEFIGMQPGMLDRVLGELEARGVKYTKRVEAF